MPISLWSIFLTFFWYCQGFTNNDSKTKVFYQDIVFCGKTPSIKLNLFKVQINFNSRNKNIYQMVSTRTGIFVERLTSFLDKQVSAFRQFTFKGKVGKSYSNVLFLSFSTFFCLFLFIWGSSFQNVLLSRMLLKQKYLKAKIFSIVIVHEPNIVFAIFVNALTCFTSK
jgi:hypothetical protein